MLPVETMSEGGRARRQLTRRERLLGVIVGILAAVGLMVALNWTDLTTTPASILNAEGHPDSTELTMYFGSCLLDYTVSVEETDDEVQVLILLAAARIDDCPDIGANETLTLKEPLGERALRDMSSGTVITVILPVSR